MLTPDPHPWAAILEAARVADAARRELRAALRAQVQELPHADDCAWPYRHCDCLRGKVLALLNEDTP